MNSVTKSSPIRLPIGQVDVWLVALSTISNDQQRACLQLLSDAEYERWQRLVVPGPRLQYLVSRALLRSTLSWYLDVPSGMWQFETNPYGRPYVSQPKASCHIQFNLSHTDGLVACGIARDCDIGVDVENIQRDLDFSALMPIVFAPVEAASVARSSAGARRDRFFCRWTLKEAYIKARGMGLSLPLDGFWFDLDGSSPRIHFTEKCPDDPRRWHFGQYTPTAEHTVAVAASLWERDRAIDMSVRWATLSPSSQGASPSFIYCNAAACAVKRHAV